MFCLRAAARRCWIYLLYCSGLLWWAERRLAKLRAVVVLTFHRVLTHADWEQTNSPEGMRVRRETFAALVKWASRHHPFVDLGRGLPTWTDDAAGLRLSFTFDDGWRDNFLEALPIASQEGVPLTIFICPALTGCHSPFWPERVTAHWKTAVRTGEIARLRELYAIQAQGHPSGTGFRELEDLLKFLKGLAATDRNQMITCVEDQLNGNTAIGASVDATMDWQEVVELSRQGTTIGSHTTSHEILPRLPSAEVREQVAGSKNMIEERLGSTCSLFAYPNGDWSAEARDVVAQVGYKAAFINRAGAWLPETDRFLVPRVNLWEGSLVGLSAQFSAMSFRYVCFWKVYRSLRPKPKLKAKPLARRSLPRQDLPAPGL